jgi:hypothetical protein
MSTLDADNAVDVHALLVTIAEIKTRTAYAIAEAVNEASIYTVA